MSEALAPDAAAPRVGLSRRPNLGGLWTVFAMSVARMVRGRRLLTLSGLYLLPVGLLLLIQARGYSPAASNEAVFVLGFFSHALVPLTALLYAPGLIQDEVEEQTLTYLMIRPLPRWQVYLAKLAAAIVVTAALAALFGALAEVVVWRDEPEFAEKVPRNPAVLAGIFALALTTYNALFALVGLVVRKSLAFGVLFVLVLEGFFSYLDFVLREATVIFYVRVLALRGMGLGSTVAEGWAIDLDLAPSAGAAATILLGAAAVLAALGAGIFQLREFRVKTPEAS